MIGTTCVLCKSRDETRDHFDFDYAFSKAVWLLCVRFHGDDSSKIYTLLGEDFTIIIPPHS
jgi:hypothetical protein